MPKKPAAQKDQLSQLWDTVLGVDGGGIKELATENHDALVLMREDIAFIKGKLNGGPSKRRIISTRLLEVAAVALVFALVYIAAVALDIITPAEGIDLIKAARGTP